MDVRKGNACLRVVCIKQVKLDILAFVLPESWFVVEVQKVKLVWGGGNNFNVFCVFSKHSDKPFMKKFIFQK
jgi:hypothetical protein